MDKNPKMIFENMKIAFASLENTKIPKLIDNIKNSHKADHEIKFEDIEEHSHKVQYN